MSPLPERMADHWWWRPGVRPGRRLLVWHILLDDQPEPGHLVRQCQDKLAGLDGLDLVPAEWLHMTTQIVGFVDEISNHEVAAMLREVNKRFAGLGPVEVELGKVWFHSEAVMLGIRPPRALDSIRNGIRAGVAETVRRHHLADEPEWTPHVSIAYSNGDGAASPIIDALSMRPECRAMKVARVHLVEQVRDGRLYRWDQRAVAVLGA